MLHIRLTFKDNHSDKFYDIKSWKDNADPALPFVVTKQFGRNGTGGQSADDERYATAAQAERAARKLRDSKTKKGYQVVIETGEVESAQQAAAETAQAAQTAANQTRQSVYQRAQAALAAQSR